MYKCQAVHSLTQALQVGLQHSMTSLVLDASYRLLECIGKYDTHTAVQMLALYQVVFC